MRRTATATTWFILALLVLGPAGCARTGSPGAGAIRSPGPEAAAASPSPVRITVHRGDTAQTLHGFGASDAWVVQYVGLWPDSLRRQMADWLFSTGTDQAGRPLGIGLSVWRFNIGAGSVEQGDASGIRTPWRRATGFLRDDGSYDWSGQAGQRWFLRAARDRGVETVIGFTNSPPVEITRTGTSWGDDAPSANLAPHRYDDFAAFLTTVARHLEEEGLPLDYLSPINEPQWDWSRENNQEGSPWLNDEIIAFTRVLDRHLAAAGLETRVEIPEAARIDFLYADDTGYDGRDDQLDELFREARLDTLPRVAAKAAGHSYFTTWPVASMIEHRQRLRDSLDAITPGLEYWMTEYCVLEDNEEIRGPGRDLGMHPALWTARLIHHDLTVAEAASWQWWLGISPFDYKDGLVYVDTATQRIHDSKLLWALGNYSRFLRPGATRLEVSRSDDATALQQATGLMVSAWRAADRRTPVVVAVNYDTLQRPITLRVEGRDEGRDERPDSEGAPIAWRPWVTDASRDLAPGEPVEAGSTTEVPARAVVTYVGQDWIDASLDRAAEQYAAMHAALPDTLFPRTLHPDGSLRTNTSEWWTSGFFPGSLWYLYEHTGDPAMRERAEARTWAVEREKWNDRDHDIGFKILNSFGHALRLTGDSVYLPPILTAARTLTTRFDSTVGAIRSWGARTDSTSPYLVIIDNMMNLELLFFAARATGDERFRDIAVSHADRTLEEHFRPDGSSYHVVEYHPVTGEVLRKRTAQGHADSSAWARGQAWGLYGYTMTYRETGLDRYLDQAKAIADFMLTHPNMPDDGVPYWDFDAPGIPDTYRDASAAAITASALLELSGFVGDSLRAAYRDHAITTLRTLSRPPYRTELGEAQNFLLRHGVGHLPENSEVDVPLSYADYYYLEGLMRLKALRSGEAAPARVVPIGEAGEAADGWARSSVNAPIFRHHSLFTHEDTQYTAFYDAEGRLVLGRRPVGPDAEPGAPVDARWELRTTPYTGTVPDAHNTISLTADGEGFLHVSWDLHDGALRYARSVEPGALELTEPLPMTGRHETAVTYPQFQRLPDGDLLFLYRNGRSGMGDVHVKRWDVDSRTWSDLHAPLIDGEAERSAYVNPLVVDEGGGWHVSWVWRETWDVATNHDILYARSPDEGRTWRRSTGERYALPITAATAEVAARVPQRRGLINQTGMTVDDGGRPVIATYWRDEGSDIPQYRLVRHDGERWRTATVGERSRAFVLEGGGTRRIPMSRPVVVAGPEGAVHVVFRDDARGPGIHVATSTDPEREEWTVREIYGASVGQWEPSYDPVIWEDARVLHLFTQRVGQGQAETLEAVPAQPVRVLEWSDQRASMSPTTSVP